MSILRHSVNRIGWFTALTQLYIVCRLQSTVSEINPLTNYLLLSITTEPTSKYGQKMVAFCIVKTLSGLILNGCKINILILKA